MIEVWEYIKNLFDAPWLENHLLYFSILGGFIIALMIFLIGLKLNKQIKEIEKRSRESMKKIIKETSKIKNKNGN